MARNPIEIPIASETKAFEAGVRSGMIEPLEDAEDTLKDLAKQGDKAGDQLEEAFEAAQKETETARKEIDELGDALEKSAKKGALIKTGVKEGTDGAIAATEEFKSEAMQNLSETVSSFRGDAEDIAQIAQDTLGGVVGNLGPVGMAAGVAGAAGIGLIINAINLAQEAEKEFRERVAELADVLIDTGGDGADAFEAYADSMRELVAPTEDGELSLNKIREQARKAGVDFADLAQAYAHAGGDLSKYADEVETLTRNSVQQGNALGDVTSEAYQQSDALIDLSGDMRDLVKEQEAAEQAQRDWIESGGAALAARAGQMDALQGELDDAIGSWSDYQNAETGATDPAAYLAAMQARMGATANFNSNVQTMAAEFGLTADEVQAILDQGVDFAPMLQSIIDNGMGEQYAEQVRSMLGGGQAIIDGTPTTVTVTTQTETDEADAELTKVAKDRPTIIGATAETRTAAAALGALASQSRVATIEARADTTAAQSALARFIAERRVIDVVINPIDREGRQVP